MGFVAVFGTDQARLGILVTMSNQLDKHQNHFFLQDPYKTSIHDNHLFFLVHNIHRESSSTRVALERSKTIND